MQACLHHQLGTSDAQKHCGLQKPSRQGAAVVEYSCVLAMILAGLMFFVTTLGTEAKVALQKIDQAVESTGDPNVVVDDIKLAVVEATPEVFVAPSKIIGTGLLVVVIGFALFVSQRCRQLRRCLTAAREQIAENRSNHVLSLLEKRQQIQLAISTHWHHPNGPELVASELMTRQLVTVTPKTGRPVIESTLRETGLHHLLVVQNHRVVGIISHNDFKSRTGQQARDVMTENVMTVASNTSVTGLINVLLKNRMSSVPVVDGDRLVGLVTMSDIAMAMQCTLRALDQITARKATGDADKAADKRRDRTFEDHVCELKTQLS